MQDKLNIKGVVTTGAPIYSDGDYSVYVGYLESDNSRDIPHYLIVNNRTQVLEDSRARLFEARAIARAYSKELTHQDEQLQQDFDIVPDEPNGNTDPNYKKNWN